jgi:acylphosphatase
MLEMVARLVYYSGLVQGVGFRATTAHLARRYPITGWVRNLPDGRVQLRVEGSDCAVEEFLVAIRAYWRNSIQDERREVQPAVGQSGGFEIIS